MTCNGIWQEDFRIVQNTTSLPNTAFRSCYYLFITVAEEFSLTGKRPLFWLKKKKQTKESVFVTICLQSVVTERKK